MTAQKLTKSLTTDSFKAFKHALQPIKVHSGTVELNRREREAMSQQQQPMSGAAEAVWGEAAHDAGLRAAVTCARTAADSTASPSASSTAVATARARPATVEPDSHHRTEERRHMPPAAVTTAATAASAAAASAPSTEPGLLPYGERGDAVPVSPPSSPMHVAAQRQTPLGTATAVESAAVAAGPEAGAGAATMAADAVAVEAAGAVRVQQSPSGGGGPAAPATAAVDIPPAALPPPALSLTTTLPAARGDEGVRSSEAAVVTPGAGAPSQPAALTSPSPLISGSSPPPPQLRLGRGRKLCPNCHALTKSAVKQCRECQHFFSPASSRLRPPPREPKENEDVPMPSRRKLRPSQRLIEYELSEASPAAATREADNGGGRPLSASARRPLAASNAGGSANQRVASGGGGGKPAAADGAAGKKPLPLGGGGGAVQPPKRSHKRKIPLPPGVAPPKRKKGAAATARALATPTTPSASVGDAAGAHRLLPSLSLPERQRVAEDLLAPGTAHTLVPRSPELTPTAAPTGPLLFMPCAASLEDDSEWPSPPHPHRVGGGGGGSAIPVSGAAAAVSLPLSVPASFLSTSSPSLGALSARGPTHGTGHETAHGEAPAPGSYAHEIAVSAAEYLLEKDPPLLLPRRQEDVLDLSAESQDKDPFEGVELWLEGGVDGEGGRGGDEVPPAVNAVSFNVPMTTFPGVGVGRDGTMEQRVLALDESMDLLGDTDDDAMWNPLRSTLGTNDDGCSSETSADGLLLWAEGMQRSLDGSDSVSVGVGDSGSVSSRRAPPPCSTAANVIYSATDRGVDRPSVPGVGGTGVGVGAWGVGDGDATADTGAGAGEGRGAASAVRPLEDIPDGFSLEPLTLADGGMAADGRSEGVDAAATTAVAMAAISLDSRRC